MQNSRVSIGVGSRLALVGAIAGLLVVAGNGVDAQPSPQSQPLVQAGNMVYLGKFSLPTSDGAGGTLTWGGAAIGLGPDGQSLYFGCHDGRGQLARVTIPAIGGVASVVEPCVAVPNLGAINPGDPNGFKLGGSLSWNGRLLVSAYSYYDASHTASSSHFAGNGLTSLTGPFRVGTDLPATVGGYMGIIPPEWRSLFGGPALTGKCCTSIVSRSSYGPAVSVFNPDHVGTLASIPSTTLVTYPEAHQNLGKWDAVSPYYTGTMRLGGVAFPGGTRSVLFVARRGDTFCYGTGAACNDPTDEDKGNHGYPYRHVVVAYDANDLLAVKQGAKNPWDVQPYTQWTLQGMSSGGAADVTSAFYDPATRRWYITPGIAGGPGTVHVYEVTNAVLQPPTPAPKNLVSQTGAGSLTLSWTPPDSGAWSHYRLEAGTSPGASDAGALVVASSATTLTLPAAGTGTFYVRLRAVFADGSEGLSNEVQVVLGAPSGPAPPTNFRATAAGSEITLSWDPVTAAGVIDVIVEVGTAPGLSNLVPAAALGRFGSFVATNVPAGRYFFRARSLGPTGPGAPTSDVEVVVGGGGSPPSSPFDLLVTVGSDRSVAITWRFENDGGAPTRFVVEAGSAAGLADLGAVTLPVSTRVDAPPVPPGVYFVRVRAGNANGLSAPSNEVRVVVP